MVDELSARISEFLRDPESFTAHWMHDLAKDMTPTQRETALETFRRVQHGAWQCTWPADRDGLRINVLVVDNLPWREVMQIAQDQWKDLLENEPISVRFCQFVPGMRSVDPAQWRCRQVSSTGGLSDEPQLVPWGHIDIILQDIYLGQGQPLGQELANDYFEVAPQAMVFLLTAMELEVLATTGVARKADRTVSKRHVLGFLWEYYCRFKELFGELLWPAWCASAGVQSGLASTANLRHLFGSLRKWHFEPEILFHGYALPEMTEHAHRHTAGLWQLAQDVLVPLLDGPRQVQPGVSLTSEERILLCLGIWMHDIGHVGDDDFTDSVSIRALHGSISDRRLLRDPDSLALGWLRNLCDGPCSSPLNGSDSRLMKANFKGDCSGAMGTLCALRRVGILARYHQQSAPMNHEAALGIISVGKPISPACRVRLYVDDIGSWRENADALETLKQWLCTERTTPDEVAWAANTVRVLEDFKDESLNRLEPLLRLLDALHLHECRVGSASRLATMRRYLKVRESSVEKRITKLECLLDQHGVHDEPGMAWHAELEELYYYRQLLQMQGIHHWIHRSVTGTRVEAVGQKLALVFTLSQKVLLEWDQMVGVSCPADDPRDHWASHVWEEFIKTELKHVRDCAPIKALGLDGAGFYKYRVDDKPDTILPMSGPGSPGPVARQRTRAPKNMGFSDRLPSRLFLDCDPGVDDALAIAIAAAAWGEIDISTTAGNVSVAQTLHNARLTAAFVKKAHPSVSFKFFRGASASLHGDAPGAASVHGRDGLGDVPLNLQDEEVRSAIPDTRRPISSIQRIIGLAARGQDSTQFVFTGPLTNLALALLESPVPDNVIKGLGRVIVMGGAFGDFGNITPGAEFNFYFDPAAVAVVLRFYEDFQRRHPKDPDDKAYPGLYFVPLNATERVQLFNAWIAPRKRLDQQGEATKEPLPLGGWMHSVLQKYFLFHSRAVRRLDFSRIGPSSPAISTSKMPVPDAMLSQLNFLDSNAYTRFRKDMEGLQRLGQGTSSKLNQLRFCHLHDPLAVWIAQQSSDKASRWFHEVRAAVHHGEGGLRGAVQLVGDPKLRRKPELTENEYQIGASVHYLDPTLFPVAEYANFLAALFDACQWEWADRDSGTRDPDPWATCGPEVLTGASAHQSFAQWLAEVTPSTAP